MRPLAERFAGKVTPGAPDECWPWQGYIAPNGYGMIYDADGRVPMTAHRAAYRLAFGPIPKGLHIDHVWDRGCRRRDCVNPAHLEAVTQAENNRRVFAAGRGKLPGLSGEQHPAARLSDEQVRAIRESPEPLKVVAPQFGISISHASRIRRGVNRAAA